MADTPLRLLVQGELPVGTDGQYGELFRRVLSRLQKLGSGPITMRFTIEVNGLPADFNTASPSWRIPREEARQMGLTTVFVGVNPDELVDE